MEKVSIIIPTFNRIHTLPDAIVSASRQSYTNVEIIVIDDGSTDNTEKTVTTRFKEVKYIYQENAGPGSARNTGIKAAQGKYIAFLDSDDLWEPDKIGLQVELMEKQKEIALCCTDFKEVAGERVRHNSVHENMTVKNGSIFEHLLKNQFIKTSTVMVRAEVLRKTGLFHEKLRAFEDRFLWFDIARAANIYFLDNCLVTARIQGDNLTSDQLLMYESFNSLYTALLKQKNLTPYQRYLIRKALSQKHNDMAYNSRMKGQTDNARALYVKSFLTYPSFLSFFGFFKTFIPRKDD